MDFHERTNKPDDSVDLDCPDCKGSGEVIGDDGVKRICSRCEGSGNVPLDEDDVV